MFLTRFSLRNRALIALVTVFVMIGGLIALGGMRRELIPPLQIPIAGVVTVVPGGTPTPLPSDCPTPSTTVTAPAPTPSPTPSR